VWGVGIGGRYKLHCDCTLKLIFATLDNKRWTASYLNRIQGALHTTDPRSRFIEVQNPYRMSCSAAKMNAVPDSGPVKTIQLKDKIIAITGANRGQHLSLSYKLLELTALRHWTGNSRLLPRQRRLQNLLHRHRHPRRRLRRHLHQVPRPALRRPGRCNQGRINPSRRRQDPRRSRRAARNGPSPLHRCPSLLEMTMHKPPE
jgi:hypothetical protein